MLVDQFENFQWLLSAMQHQVISLHEALKMRALADFSETGGLVPMPPELHSACARIQLFEMEASSTRH